MIGATGMQYSYIAQTTVLPLPLVVTADHSLVPHHLLCFHWGQAHAVHPTKFQKNRKIQMQVQSNSCKLE